MIRGIDAHQHFWRYRPEEFEWIDDSMAAIQRDYLPADLRPLLASNGMQGSIAVQARQTLEETEWLLELARQNPDVVCGVVGWAPLEAPELPAVLERLTREPLLRGLRHVVQAEPDGFLLSPSFEAGVRRLAGTGLVYDLLILAHQMPEAIRFVDRHPDLPVVLDHLGKPDLRALQLEPWAGHLQQLARRPNVFCKLSGMVTEAAWACWSAEQLQPFFEVALEAFTPSRLLAGSDWPVLEVASSYTRWWQTLRGWTAGLTASEKEQLFGGTAAAVYRVS